MPNPARSWMLRYREARVHALIAASLLWIGAATVVFASPGDRYLTGHLKGADFIQVYTLAHLAFEGRYPRLGEYKRFHDRQVELVPAASERYLPVYPPTAALFFAPLRHLSYLSAVAAWAAITLVGYALIMWATWRQVQDVLPDGVFFARAAAAFPPFWLLVLYGQTTLIPLASFFLAWWALRAGKPFLAGVALGLLSVKPQFGVVFACVLLLNGRWSVIAGAAFSGAIQLLAVAGTMGTQALWAYANTVANISAVDWLLQPDSWRMHSLRTVTNLLPGDMGTLVWLALSAVVVGVSVRAWRTPAPLEPRLGLVVLATVLVNPHLFVYDATVLVLPLVWLGGWLEREKLPLRTAYWQSVYLLFVLLLIPTARFVFVQGSVLLMVWIFWSVWRLLLRRPGAEALTPLGENVRVE